MLMVLAAQSDIRLAAGVDDRRRQQCADVGAWQVHAHGTTRERVDRRARTRATCSFLSPRLGPPLSGDA